MTKKRPNILFITTDQQRKDTVSCYGNPLIQTPNLDRLAAEGMVFNRAYCESPICIPSRITMITGKTSAHHGATHHNNNMRDGERTIGSALSENGYRTHFIGKPHFKSQQHRGTEESIADWRDGKYEDWNGPYAGFETVQMILGHSNSLYGHYGKWLREEHPETYHHFIADHMQRPDISSGHGVFKNNIPEEVYSSTYVGEQTCEFLTSMEGSEKPFYCFASFPDPHWPIMPPSPFFEMYDGIDIPPVTPYNGEAEKDNYPRQFKRAREGGRTGYNGGGHYMSNPEDAATITRAYWGSVSLIDKNVGKMLDKLDELGMADNTIVVFTSDHGEYMGSHGLMAKGGFLWEEFVNIPFLIRCPEQVKAGAKTEALLSFIDLVPTLLDAAGIENHGMAADGVSQMAVIRGELESVRDSVMVMHAGNDPRTIPDQHALINKEWKLVYYAGDPNGELYNLIEDPSELNNLYNKPAAQAIQQQLIMQLMERKLMEMDREPVLHMKSADQYGAHKMAYAVWKDEFDRLEELTGRLEPK